MKLENGEETISKLSGNRRKPYNSGNLFLTRLGTIETINNYKISFNALREKYGLNYTTHLTKHTFISKMQSLNVSISKLKKLLVIKLMMLLILSIHITI